MAARAVWQAIRPPGRAGARLLNPALNKGKPGWNDDEPAVAEATCELAVREYFGGDYDVRAITSFVSVMRFRIHSVAPLGSWRPRL